MLLFKLYFIFFWWSINT